MSNLFDNFDEFYAAYPRKVGKPQARKAYEKAMKRASHDEIMHGLSQQLSAIQAKEKQFVPHPATWLNRDGWNDEADNVGGGSTTNAGTDQIAFAAAAHRSPRGDCY